MQFSKDGSDAMKALLEFSRKQRESGQKLAVLVLKELPDNEEAQRLAQEILKGAT